MKPKLMQAYMLMTMLLGGCTEESSNQDYDVGEQHPVVVIEMNTPFRLAMDNSPVPFEESCIDAISICSMEHNRRMGDPNLPAVQIGGVLLEQVARISIFADVSFSQNIESLRLTLRGLPSNSLHDEQRLFAYQIIDQLRAAGWQNYYSPADPRISSSEADKIKRPREEAPVLSHAWMDPAYAMPLQRWNSVGFFYNWHFFKNGVYLHLRGWRKNSREAPEQRGTYLFTLNFQTENDYWRLSIPEEKRDNWQAEMPALISTLRGARKEAEAAARARGIEIDETYQDPPFPGVTDDTSPKSH